jgi:ornithine cyclodeaminase/alanine dehydrogenase
MPSIIEALESMFTEKGHGRVEMPPKPGIHPKQDSFIHAMPAYIPDMGAAGIKWVSGYPRNQERGLPYINGLLILNHPETGIPAAIMDCTWITAQRTGAATAVAAKYMARPDSESVGILACGVQGRSNLEALNCVFKLKKVKAYDLFHEVAVKFAKEVSESLGLEIEVVRSPDLAVRGMDLIVSSGPILKDPKPVIEPGWIKPGSFSSPVDFDSYFTAQAMATMDVLTTDDFAQMEYYREAGYFKRTPTASADLGELVCGLKPGRTSPEQRTMSINLGIALEDMATAPMIYRRALEMNIGRRLPL